MAKEVIKVDEDKYTCDICGKEADDRYVERNGYDFCYDHGEAVSYITERLTRANKEISEAMIKEFLEQMEDMFRDQVVVYIKNLKDKKEEE